MEPSPAPPDNPRDAAILLERFHGATQVATAERLDVSESTVRRVEAEHRDFLDHKRREAARTFVSELERSVRALMATAQDSSNRNQVSAFEAGCEKLLGWGGHGDVTVMGDVTIDASTVNVDARAVHLAASDPKLRAERAAELDRVLGIGE